MAQDWECACNQKQRGAIVPGEVQIEDCDYSLEVVVAGEGIAVGDSGLAEIFILPACV